MKRRGFLQAVFGAAAVPAAIKAAEAFDQVPDLPVAKPAGRPLDIESIHPTSAMFFTAGVPVAAPTAEWRDMYGIGRHGHGE